MSENSNGMSSIFAFLLGGIIGAGLALLYAPSSGEETRRRIKDQVDQARDRARERYESAIDTVEEGVGRVKDMVDERKGEVVAAYQGGKEAYLREKTKHAKETA